MSLNLGNIFEDHREFIHRNDRNSLILTSKAAEEACRQASIFGLSIAKVEGGLWHNPGFESRIDAIWETRNYPASLDEVRKLNALAADFIRDQSSISPDSDLPPADVFMITANTVETFL